jgi:poly(3-hydroxybutyrate) depolymerase
MFLRPIAYSTVLAAAVLGHVATAHAQNIPPFGIPCHSVGVSGIPYVRGINCRLMNVDGYTRRFVVWIPLAGVPANSPAVFMAHGGSGTGEDFLRTSGWRQKADQEGFIAIFPTAVEHFILDHQRFSTHWNDYPTPFDIDPNRRPPGYPATSPWPADDVKFVRRIAADVIQHALVDPHRVFVAGFSNGGGLCARLGVEASDLIAAVACHTGGLKEVHETVAGRRNLSAFFTLGTRDGNALDFINDYLDHLGLPPIAELPLDPVLLDRIPQIKTQLLTNFDSFDLAATPIAATTGPNFTLLRAQTPQAGNNDGNELFVVFLDEVTHQYPNGTNNPFGFNVPDFVWPFFLQHPRP